MSYLTSKYFRNDQYPDNKSKWGIPPKTHMCKKNEFDLLFLGFADMENDSLRTPVTIKIVDGINDSFENTIDYLNNRCGRESGIIAICDSDENIVTISRIRIKNKNKYNSRKNMTPLND